MRQHSTKQPPAKAGGFTLRTGSPDTCRLNNASYGVSILNSLFGLGIKMMPQLLFNHFFRHLPNCGAEVPSRPKMSPQYPFFRWENSSNSRLAVLPLIRRIISLGAIVGRALIKICTCSLLTTPLTIRISNVLQT